MCVAAAIGGAALVGGAIQGQAAESAAQTQAGAAENAQQISQNEFNTITAQEQPFMQGGKEAPIGHLITDWVLDPNSSAAAGGTGLGYGSLTTPFTTQNWQQLSPQYNFTKQQGQQGVLNADASQQGSLSGSAAKDLINYNQSRPANQSFGRGVQPVPDPAGEYIQPTLRDCIIRSGCGCKSRTAGNTTRRPAGAECNQYRNCFSCWSDRTGQCLQRSTLKCHALALCWWTAYQSDLYLQSGVSIGG